MVLGVVDISDISHTSENLAIVIRSIIKKFKLVGIVSLAKTDNARNIGTTCEELGVKQIGCFAHTINLVVYNAIGETVLQPKVFKDNVVREKVLLNERVPVNYRILVTRWNNVHKMLKSLNEYNDCVM